MSDFSDSSTTKNQTFKYIDSKSQERGNWPDSVPDTSIKYILSNTWRKKTREKTQSKVIELLNYFQFLTVLITSVPDFV